MHFLKSIRGGTIFASLAAGPLLLLSLACTAAVISPQAYFSLTPRQAGFFLGVLAASVPCGFLATVLPALFGSAVMFWLGKISVDARSPVFWAGGGALVAGTALVAMMSLVGGADRPLGAILQPAPIVMIPAALCALISRSKMHWAYEG